MKKFLLLTTALVVLASCSDEGFVGNDELYEANKYGMPISFNLKSAEQTRAAQEGADAATALNNNFVIWGTKTVAAESGSGTEVQTVFHNYQVNYVNGSEGKTTTNSSGWEYVGYKNVPNGVTTNTGVTAFASAQTESACVDQSIKYWDFSATQYNFFGYSLGAGVTSGTPATTIWATSSAMSSSTYNLSGTSEQLASCYISDYLTKTDMSNTNTKVTLSFRKLESKVKIALYETIPGYSVKDVKFYPSGTDATPGTTAYLYSSSASIPKEGTFTVTFDGTLPRLAWAAKTGSTDNSNVSFGTATPTGTEWEDWAAPEYRETAGDIYIGRSSNSATKYKGWKSVLPNPNASGATLNLKVDYTLVSRDGYGETIKVKGATAVIPAQYAVWEPNYAYTYVFKISDNTNGQTGSISGLYPITLDAVVNTDASGHQETITTVSEPSITTFGYKDNAYIQGGSDYPSGSDVYVVVVKGSAVVTPTLNTNTKFYTVTTDNPTSFPITEAAVAHHLNLTTTSGSHYTVTGYGTTGTNLSVVSEVPSSVSGKTITIDAIKMTSPVAGTYAVEFIDTDDSSKKYYKIITITGS